MSENIEEVEEISEFVLIDGIEGELFCVDCSLPFETIDEWSKHTAECHNEKELSVLTRNIEKFNCNVCGAGFTRKNNLLRHLRKFHENVIIPFRRTTYVNRDCHECPECENKFTRKSNLLRHVRRFHDYLIPAIVNQSPKLHFCPDCYTGFTKWSNCKRHIKHFHGSESVAQLRKPVFADSKLLSVEPDTGKTLDVPKDTVELPSIFPCSECELHFVTDQGLRRHMGLVHAAGPVNHQSKNSRIETCPLCSFHDTKLNLYIHFTSVHDQPILIECHDFNTLDEFVEWRARIESETEVHFDGMIKKVPTSDNCRTVFTCSHSSLNRFCPAEITLIITKERCTVNYVKTHVGHAKSENQDNDSEEIAEHGASGIVVKVENAD